MNRSTRAQLRELNRRFYQQSGDAFASTRDHAWPGWVRMPLPARTEPSKPLRVLDVGCGNARFAAALRERLGAGFLYCGVDESATMLSHAEKRLAALGDIQAELLRADILEEASRDGVPAAAFDLVVAFGLLHHVPGSEARQAFVAELARRVAIGGVLAITAWQFAGRPRFADRIVPWSELELRGGPPIDPAQLEPGDHLLGFGDPSPALRYCHHCDDAELDALVAPIPLDEVARFSADGRDGDLNRYVVLRQNASDEPT